MPGHYTFHGGSTLLQPLADSIGLRVDQVNFVICQFFCLMLSIAYYNFCPPDIKTRNLRLRVPAIIGVILCFFCFGYSIKHLLADGIGCYLILRLLPVKYVHKATFVFGMGYLSFIHFYRAKYARTYMVDVTGPMMVLTQKVTALAFSVHDGSINNGNEDLTPTQKRELIKQIPSPAEYFCYLYSFMGVLCGPLCFYTDFIAFVDGVYGSWLSEDKLRKENGSAMRPSPKSAVCQKLIYCCICLILNVFVVPQYPFEDILSAEKGFFEKLFFAHISLTLVRTQYYYAWIMADCINNAAGFGFNGYDDKGNSKWDLISNIDVWKFETADNLKDSLDAWNRGTMYWLRRVAYERTPKKYRTIFTYVVSAWWHGFFTGYYATFLTGALFTEASRMARKQIRPMFQDTKIRKMIYNTLTYVVTRIAICYAAATFVLLHWREALQFYTQMYFFMHIAAAALLITTPRILRGKEDKKAR